MVLRGEADGMICGTVGSYGEHYEVVKDLFGFREGVHAAGAMNALLLPTVIRLSQTLMSMKTLHRKS